MKKDSDPQQDRNGFQYTVLVRICGDLLLYPLGGRPVQRLKEPEELINNA